MQTRLLFLEFDGVLHPARDGADISQHFLWLDILVQLLAPWPDVGLVVRSTWRYIHTPAALRSLFGLLGPRFICRVPRVPRQMAIEWFLLLNPCFATYLTVGDAPNAFIASVGERLVVRPPSAGISEPRVLAQIRAWLDESFIT